MVIILHVEAGNVHFDPNPTQIWGRNRLKLTWSPLGPPVGMLFLFGQTETNVSEPKWVAMLELP